MSRTVKTFRVVEEEQAAEPLPFEFELIPRDGSALDSIDVGDGSVRYITEDGHLVERFEAMGKAPAGAQLALASMIHYGSRGQRNIDMNGMMEFFQKVMTEEDYTRLRDLFDDKRWTIHIDLVGDVFKWLTEEYSGRPTKRSRHSSRMPAADGRTGPVAVIPLQDDSVVETSSS